MEEETKGLEEPEAIDGYINPVSESNKAIAHMNTCVLSTRSSQRKSQPGGGQEAPPLAKGNLQLAAGRRTFSFLW